MEIIEKAKKKGQKSLSEYQSKLILKSYGVKFAEEILTKTWDDIKSASRKIGFPVVLKACSPNITHKTEKKLIEVGINNIKGLEKAYNRISRTVKNEELEGYLVQEKIGGKRELMVGLVRDETFGPCVMFGLGGIFTEVLRDVVFRVAPIERDDAYEMINEIKSTKILDNFRGEAEVDRKQLAETLVNIGRLGTDIEEIKEIDINPLIIKENGEPACVDALIVLI